MNFGHCCLLCLLYVRHLNRRSVRVSGHCYAERSADGGEYGAADRGADATRLDADRPPARGHLRRRPPHLCAPAWLPPHPEGHPPGKVVTQLM